MHAHVYFTVLSPLESDVNQFVEQAAGELEKPDDFIFIQI